MGPFMKAVTHFAVALILSLLTLALISTALYGLGCIVWPCVTKHEWLGAIIVVAVVVGVCFIPCEENPPLKW